MSRAERFHKKQKFKTIIICIIITLVVAAGTTAAVFLIIERAPQAVQVSNRDYAKALAQLNQSLQENIEKVKSAADVPDSLRQLYERNPETLDFVLGYKEAMQNPAESKLTKEEAESDNPYFLQWDKRWGYTQYCNGYFAVTACGPTCLSMVITGLTHNQNASPRVIADYSERNGYSIPGTGTAWALMPAGAKTYGLKAKELPLDENVMITELGLGHPIICALAPGDFTQVGHFIVIYQYKDGAFIVHDPNSPVRSSCNWDYDTLKGQILNLWSFSVK